MSLINVNSISNKLTLVKYFLSHNNIDILAVTETWLLPSIPDSFVAIPNFKDTSENTSKHVTCLYIRNIISYFALDLPVRNIVGVHLPSYDAYILAAYRPPSNSHLHDFEFISFLERH